MSVAGLWGRQKRRFKKTTITDGLEPRAVDLLGRAFAPGQLPLDTAWVGDITYIRTWEGWAYLATVIDLASRRVVGFAVANHMRTELITRAMEMALHFRRPAAGLIFHSDRGSQYTSNTFRELLGRHHIRQSLSRPRQCWDNAVAESFFVTLKTDSSIGRSSRPSRPPAPRSSNTSKSSTTVSASIQPSTTRPRQPTNPVSSSNHLRLPPLNKSVRHIGATPNSTAVPCSLFRVYIRISCNSGSKSKAAPNESNCPAEVRP